MTVPIIETPRGRIIRGKGVKAELIWNPQFQPKYQGQYTSAQKFMDSEVLRLSEPYVPLLTSMLIKSGILGTFIGSGLVHYIAPYAKGQYYRGRRPGQSSTGPLRGRFWFERMKATFGRKLVAAARKLAGRGNN